MRPQQGQMQSPTPWANWLASDWTGQLRAVSESSCRNVLSVGLHGSATARQSPRLRNPRGTMRIPTESTCRRRGKIQSPIRRPILSPLLMLGRNIPRIPHIPRCAWCGQSESHDAVVPFGTEPGTHLHRECWSEWHKMHRSQAKEALTRMGIGDLSDGCIVTTRLISL